MMHPSGHTFRHVPLGTEPQGRPRRFPYAGMVFVAYGIAIPLIAGGSLVVVTLGLRKLRTL